MDDSLSSRIVSGSFGMHVAVTPGVSFLIWSVLKRLVYVGTRFFRRFHFFPNRKPINIKDSSKNY